MFISAIALIVATIFTVAHSVLKDEGLPWRTRLSFGLVLFLMVYAAVISSHNAYRTISDLPTSQHIEHN